MRRVERLKKEARRRCEDQGHAMSAFQTIIKGEWVGAVCVHHLCYLGVEVDARVRPRKGAISGPALATRCGDREVL